MKTGGSKRMSVRREIVNGAGACVAALCLLAATESANASLVLNGSFELGAFVDDGDNTMNLVVGSTALTDWNVTSGALAWIKNGNPFGTPPLSASDGQYFLDLAGYHDNQPYGGVAASTSIVTLIGQQYRVQFDLGSDSRYNTASPSVQVNVTGIPSATFTAGPIGQVINRWESFGLVFTATSANTTLSFAGVGADNQAYVGLDNVSLIAVPEPTTMIAGALLLLPFGASLIRKLRKA
jgi:hypothetical protein